MAANCIVMKKAACIALLVATAWDNGLERRDASWAAT
jgi:hypothetical protein